jgi:hypothetical protein
MTMNSMTQAESQGAVATRGRGGGGRDVEGRRA